MSFFNNLLESSGCNPDGSIGQNPLTSFVEKTFEFFPQTTPDQQFHNDHTHFLIQQQQPQQAGDPHYQADPGMSSAINVGPMMMFPPSAPHHHQPLLHPPHQPYYPPPSYYPMPFPQQHMIPLQYMQQAPMPLTQQPQPLSQPQQPQLSSEAERQVDAETDKYARFQEIIRAANRDLNKTNWTILDDEEDDRLDSDNTSQTFPSKQGYQQAWDSLERKLTSGELSGERQYQYEEANPFLHSTTVNDVTALYEEALRHYEEGDVNLAVLKLEAIVQKDNNGAELAEVWRLLGTCHAENDDEPKAIYCLEKAVDYDPYHLSTLLSLGTCYVNELDSIKALETLRTWVTNNPKFLGLEVTHDEYSDGTLMDEVMQLILSVAAHSPDDAEVQVLLGVLYNISQDFDSALDCFHKALESSQNIDYNLLNKLGATLANSNRSAQALPYYSKALEQRPKFVRGWRNLGIAHANCNEYEPAAKAYLQALHLNPGARHIWSYVRVVLTCMERMDLVELSTKEDVRALAQALDTQLI